MKARLSALTAATLLLAAPAWAHHSGAMYEPTKVVAMTATVMAFSWKNPHAEIQVLANDPTGKSEQWSLECSTPNILARKGWANDSMKPGDKISVTMRPMKDGTKGGQILTLVTAKGVTLKDHDY